MRHLTRRQLGAGRLWALGALAALSLGAACGDSAKERARAARAAALASAVPAPPPTAPPAPPIAPAGTAPMDGDNLLGGSLAGAKPPADEPPELTAVKGRIIRGDRSTHALKELQRLSYKYPKNAEVAYILGQLYFSKLWVSDGLEFFRKAVVLDSTFRTNPYLIKAAVNGLGNDGDHLKVRRFLVKEIGKPAAPFLDEILHGDYRQQVKDRATTILHELK